MPNPGGCPAETRGGLLTALADPVTQLGSAAADEPDLKRQRKQGCVASPSRARPGFLSTTMSRAQKDRRIVARFRRAGADHVTLCRLERLDGRSHARRVAAGRGDHLSPEPCQPARRGRRARRSARLSVVSARLRSRVLQDCKRMQTHFTDDVAKAANLIAAALRGALLRAHPGISTTTADINFSLAFVSVRDTRGGAMTQRTERDTLRCQHHWIVL